MKAQLDCSLPDKALPFIVQSVFLLKHGDWQESCFYVVFTSALNRISTVCVYPVGSMSKVFYPGWGTFQCARDGNYITVVPETGRPLLVKEGALLSQIVVESVVALDGTRHAVMFIGTENGFIQKAVNYDGETLISEEIQVYPTPQRISILRLSPTKDQLFVESKNGVVQMPVINCSRYDTCKDCVLAIEDI
ncbi:semaphorin-4E-like [Vanacampus margaritifer]